MKILFNIITHNVRPFFAKFNFFNRISPLLKRNFFSKIFTWKNLIRGIGTAICAIIIRLVIKYYYNIDIITDFLENHTDIKNYLYAFAYFISNYFISITIGEFFEQFFINRIKDSTSHFLGISLGIDRLKLSLDGSSDFKYSSNIKEIPKPVKEGIVLQSSRESSSSRESVSSSTYNSSSRHRSLSPFSRPASPPTFSRQGSPGLRAVSPAPSFGQDEFDPRTEPGYHPGSPINPSSIWPDYFKQDFASPRPPVVWYMDTVIQHICRATYNIHGPIAMPGNVPWEDDNTWAILPPFGYDPTLNRHRNNPFHTWYPITNMNQCTVLHLKCIIARLEQGKVILEITNDNDSTVPIIEGMPKSSRVIDQLLRDANRALIAKTTNSNNTSS